MSCVIFIRQVDKTFWQGSAESRKNANNALMRESLFVVFAKAKFGVFFQWRGVCFFTRDI